MGWMSLHSLSWIRLHALALLGRRGLFKNWREVVITLKLLMLKAKFCLCQVQDSSFALTPLFSVLTCLKQLASLYAICLKQRVLVLRLLWYSWLSLADFSEKNPVWAQFMVIISPDFFVQTLNLQPVTLSHIATGTSEYFKSFLLRVFRDLP